MALRCKPVLSKFNQKTFDATVPKLKSSIQEARLSSTFLYKYTSVVFSSSRRQHTKLCTADTIKCPGRPFSELQQEETAHLVCFYWGAEHSLHQNPCQLKLQCTDGCFFLHENITCFQINKQVLSLQLENLAKGCTALGWPQSNTGWKPCISRGHRMLSEKGRQLSTRS